MSYNKHTWANGNIVGAVDLNRMEDGIEAASSGCGYECTEESTVLTDETVTTTYDSDEQVNLGSLAYSQLINADKIRVTFNGVEYECNAHTRDGLGGKIYGYGGVGEESSDFSEYPFAILSAPNIEATTQANNDLLTPSAGTHTIKIEALEPIVTTTPCFNAAVKSAAPGPLWVKYDSSDANANYYDKTPRQVTNALNENRIVCMKDGSGRVGYLFSKSTLACSFITAENNAVFIRTLTANGLDQKLSESIGV